MIINLTQHTATPEQVAVGVVDLPETERAALQALLTFDTLPSAADVAERAGMITKLATEASATRAMIGGAPFLMSALESALTYAGIEVLYAFSVRESVDQPQADGSVHKVAVFRHAGFVKAL